MFASKTDGDNSACNTIGKPLKKVRIENTFYLPVLFIYFHFFRVDFMDNLPRFAKTGNTVSGRNHCAPEPLKNKLANVVFAISSDPNLAWTSSRVDWQHQRTHWSSDRRGEGRHSYHVLQLQRIRRFPSSGHRRQRNARRFLGLARPQVRITLPLPFNLQRCIFLRLAERRNDKARHTRHLL